MPDIESLLKEKRVFKPSSDAAREANWNRRTAAAYRKQGEKSVETIRKMATGNRLRVMNRAN